MELLISYLDQKNLINIPDRNGLTCLFYAIKVQNGVPILKLLFQKNLVNKSQSDKEKNTALHFAIIQKNYDAIVVLLENGLDIDARNTDGRTSLMLAALSGDEKLTEYLLENGADIMVKDKSGQTAVDLSKKSRNEKCIALLQQNRYSGRTQSEDRVDTETDSANILKGEKKFEGLFAKKNVSPNKSEGNLATSRAASSLNKYKIEDDESQATEEKVVLSHDKSEKGNTWTNSDEEDDDDEDDDDDDEEEGVSSAPKSEKEYASMFSSIKKEKQGSYSSIFTINKKII
jgi:ankyrin repeat protein